MLVKFCKKLDKRWFEDDKKHWHTFTAVIHIWSYVRKHLLHSFYLYSPSGVCWYSFALSKHPQRPRIKQHLRILFVMNEMIYVSYSICITSLDILWNNILHLKCLSWLECSDSNVVCCSSSSSSSSSFSLFITRKTTQFYVIWCAMQYALLMQFIMLMCAKWIEHRHIHTYPAANI